MNEMFDIINASFEGMAGLAVADHCRSAIRDKDVQGVSVVAVAFFTLWGLWNMIYYPHLGQTWSFLCGFVVCAMNFAYIGLLIHYGRRRTKCQSKVR